MMERILLGVFFLSGWFILSTCLHQYHFVSDTKTWTEAQTYCRDTYTDLATIDNTEDMNQFINNVSSAGYNSEVWIGLYSNIDWQWSDGYRGTGADYRNWGSPDPNCFAGNEFCVKTKNGRWYDTSCSTDLTFICSNGTQQDPEFAYVNERMNWSNAQRYCRENYIDLATVRNNSANQKITDLVPSYQRLDGHPHVVFFNIEQVVVPYREAWIGLFRHPNIYWSDGSSYSFKNWDDDYNPLGNASNMCGAADLQRSGRWRIIPCGTRLPFVCYSSPPVKKQIFKLKMKMNFSVDPNDLAVKAELLKQLQDRLKEKGVSGVTLKWREQPDGKVFHKEEKREKCEL